MHFCISATHQDNHIKQSRKTVLYEAEEIRFAARALEDERFNTKENR